MSLITLITATIAKTFIFNSGPIQGLLGIMGLAGATITAKVFILLTIGCVIGIGLGIGLGAILYTTLYSQKSSQKSSPKKRSAKIRDIKPNNQPNNQPEHTLSKLKVDPDGPGALMDNIYNAGAQELQRALTEQTQTFIDKLKTSFNKNIIQEAGLNIEGFTPAVIEQRLQKALTGTMESLEAELGNALSLEPNDIAQIYQALNITSDREMIAQILALYAKKEVLEGEENSVQERGLNVGLVNMYLNRMKGFYIPPVYLPTETINTCLAILFALVLQSQVRASSLKDAIDIQKAKELKQSYDAFKAESEFRLTAQQAADPTPDGLFQNPLLSPFERLNLAAAREHQGVLTELSEQYTQTKQAYLQLLNSEAGLDYRSIPGTPHSLLDDSLNQELSIRLSMLCNIDKNVLMLLLAKYTEPYCETPADPSTDPLAHIKQWLGIPSNGNPYQYYEVINRLVRESLESYELLQDCARVLWCLAIIQQKEGGAYARIIEIYQYFSYELEALDALKNAKARYAQEDQQWLESLLIAVKNSIRDTKPANIAHYITQQVEKVLKDEKFKLKTEAAKQALSKERAEFGEDNCRVLDIAIYYDKPEDIEDYTRRYIADTRQEEAQRKEKHAQARVQRINKLKNTKKVEASKHLKDIEVEELKEYLNILCPAIIEKLDADLEALPTQVHQLQVDNLALSGYQRICFFIVKKLAENLSSLERRYQNSPAVFIKEEYEGLCQNLNDEMERYGKLHDFLLQELETRSVSDGSLYQSDTNKTSFRA